MSVNEREEAIMQEEKMHRSTYRVLKIFELLSATSEGMSLTGLAQTGDSKGKSSSNLKDHAGNEFYQNE